QEAMPWAFCGFTAIASLTLFFSFQRKLFVRFFVPRDEWKEALRSLPRDPEFGRGMRIVAVLQFAVALVFGLVSLWLTLVE
ncbi:MAG: hypothetical protein KDA84_11245, partial [Planctomycetaceae bacterium]|nr:hypothetical protein [Planctomycetaceae bacterium]